MAENPTDEVIGAGVRSWIQQGLITPEIAQQALAQLPADLEGRKQAILNFDTELQRQKALAEYKAKNPAFDPNSPFNLVEGKVVPNIPAQEYGITKAKAGATTVQNITRQETEEAKAVGKGYGEAFNDIQKSGRAADSKISRYSRLGQLLDGVETGKLTPAFTEVAALADSLGFKIDPNLDAKQAVMALSNEIALTLRNPEGGAGMPGALSDKDREFLVSMTPGLAKTPGGNRMIIETATKLAQRERDIARMARAYRKKHGSLDEGFYDELERFANANPLFASVATGRQASGKIGAPSSKSSIPAGISEAEWGAMTPEEKSLWQR